MTPKVIPEDKEGPHKPQGSPRCRTTRNKKVAGKCVREPVRPKLDMVSVRQAIKTAKKNDQPMFLCVLRATDFPVSGKKRPNSGRGTY